MTIDEESLRRQVKAELRKRLRGLRKTTPASSITARSIKIIAHVEELDVVRNARTIALFWPMVARHEVDLRPFDGLLRRRGVRVAYPSIDQETHVMTFRFIDEPTSMHDAGLGFLEPDEDAPVAARGDLDVVIAPALAVDPRGHRLGYGAGYYDRTLPAYVPPATSIAVAFDFQLLADIPSTDTDVPVQWIVTDTRVLEAKP